MKKSSREILFPQKRGTPITRVLDKLRKRETVTLGPASISTSPEKGELKSIEKQEAYAMIAYFIEQIQSRIQFPDPTDSFATPVRLTYPPEPHLRTKVSPKAAQNSLNVFDYTAPIRRTYSGLFATALRAWEEDMLRQPKGAYDVRAYKRLEALIKTLPFANDLSVERFILRGANTAGEISWDTLRAIPLAFTQTYQRPPTPEEYTKLANEAEALVVMMATVHLETLHIMFKYAGEMGSKEANRAELAFPLEFFTIEDGKDGTPTIRLNEETLQKFDEYVQARGLIMEQARLRCPALDVRVKDANGQEQNLVSMVYAFYRDAAGAYIVPQLERFTAEGVKRMQTPA